MHVSESIKMHPNTAIKATPVMLRLAVLTLQLLTYVIGSWDMVEKLGVTTTPFPELEPPYASTYCHNLMLHDELPELALMQ